MRAAGNQSVGTKHKKYFSPYLFYMVKLKLIFILSAGEIFSQFIVLAEGADLGLQTPAVCNTVQYNENPSRQVSPQS